MIQTHEPYEPNVPISHQGRDYAELRVRRPTAKDLLRGVKRGTTGLEEDLRQLVDLCEVPPEVINSLDVSDVIGLQAVMKGFLYASEQDVRRAIVILSTRTGWDLATLENRPVEDIVEWLKTLDDVSPRK